MLEAASREIRPPGSFVSTYDTCFDRRSQRLLRRSRKIYVFSAFDTFVLAPGARSEVSPPGSPNLEHSVCTRSVLSNTRDVNF